VYADEKMLLSILQNIVSNAIKLAFIMEQITLSIKRSDDMMGERQERSLGLLLVKSF
jgi:two-component system CheB/CheR fusion protein